MDAFFDVAAESDMAFLFKSPSWPETDSSPDLDTLSESEMLFNMDPDLPMQEYRDVARFVDEGYFSDTNAVGFDPDDFSDMEYLVDDETLLETADPFMEMKMLARVVSDPLSSLEEKNDAAYYLNKFPKDLLKTFQDTKQWTDYDSADDRLADLHILYEVYDDCYKHELSPTILDNEFDFYADLLEGCELVKREINQIIMAKADYQSNLAILYGQYQDKKERLLADGIDVYKRSPVAAANAFLKLEHIVSSTSAPLIDNAEYLVDINKFWHTVGGPNDRVSIEPVYEWIMEPLDYVNLWTNILAVDGWPQDYQEGVVEKLIHMPKGLLHQFEWCKDDLRADSANERLWHLYEVRRYYYECYTYIAKIYGSGVISPYLHFTHPWHRQLYHALLGGHHNVQEEIDRITTAQEEYLLDLNTLLIAYIRKFSRSPAFAKYYTPLPNMSSDVVEASRELYEILGGEIGWVPSSEDRPKYLGDIARFWRTVGGMEDREPVQRVWEWVAGRPLRME